MVRGSPVTISRGLKSNFALKNISLESLPGPITRRINVMYESQMTWTWHQSKLAVEEVSFFGRLRVVLLQLLIYTRWSSWRYGLGLGVMLLWSKQLPTLSRIRISSKQIKSRAGMNKCIIKKPWHVISYARPNYSNGLVRSSRKTMGYTYFSCHNFR